MLRALLVLVVVIPLLAADEKSDADRKKLHGIWRPISVQEGGREDPEAKEHTLTFTADEFVIKKADQLIVKGTFKLDAAKTPKQIDMMITDGLENLKGKSSAGIYEFDGETLKWCTTEPGGAGQRPTRFAAEAGTDHMFVTLKREKK